MTLRDARVVVRLALPIKRRGNPLRIFTLNSIKGTPPRLTRRRVGFVYKNGQKTCFPYAFGVVASLCPQRSD